MKRLLPTRPRIASYFDIIFTQDDGCQLRAGDDQILVLRGKTVTETLPQLVPYLNGIHTLADIVDKCKDIVSEQDLMTILERLNEEGILEDATTPPAAALSPKELGYYAPQLQFFSHFPTGRYSYQAKLKESRAAVIGLGSIGTSVVMSLAMSGIGHLTGYDDKIGGPVAQPLRHWESDHNQPPTTALASFVSRSNPHITFQGVDDGLRTVEEVSRAVKGNDVVVVAFDKPRLAIYEWVNQVCLDEGVPWITCGSLNSIEGIVGPFIVPHETCCYRCYDLRLKGNLDGYSQYLVFEEYLREKEGRTAEYGYLPPFAAVIGHFIALEVIKHLTQIVPPETYGSVFSINLLTLQAKVHEVFKLPRCPSCGPASLTPPSALWSR